MPSLADHYQAALIFTPTKVLTMPMKDLDAQGADILGHRADTGLYVTDIKNLNKVYSNRQRYDAPCSAAVGAQLQSEMNDRPNTDKDGARVLHAMAIRDSNRDGSFKRPKLRRHEKGTRASFGDVGKRRGVRWGPPPKKGGDKMLKRAPEPTAKRPDGRQGSKIRFIDLCAGIGGSRMACACSRARCEIATAANTSNAASAQ